MSDLLMKLNSNPVTGWLAKSLGLPNPVLLAREQGPYSAQPFMGKTVCLLGEGYATNDIKKIIIEAGAQITPEATSERIDCVLMDATGFTTPDDYRVLYEGFKAIIRRIEANGRVLIMAPLVAEAQNSVAAAVARGIEGFSRTLGKELGVKGISVNLANVSQTAADRLSGVIRFFTGPQCAYVSGQAVSVTPAVVAPTLLPVEQVLRNKVAVVTGSARGIGLATAQRLAQEGAQVICLDVPAMADELNRVCLEIGATPLTMDISAADTPQKLADLLLRKFGGVDIVVHNAGVTRDKTLANMKDALWDLVVSINLSAIIAIDKLFMEEKVLRNEGRIVCLSSISGVAGNYGQSNYATTKAALIGYVAAQAPLLAQHGICINAVAPGFIETAMTDAMPFGVREVGKRLNSVKQGGTPRDVAELITFLCSPGAFGVTGNTIRVCGQGLIGA